MLQSYWRRLASIFAFALVASLAIPVAAGASSGYSVRERTYVVTIENLTEGQPFTPPVLATHGRRADVFTVGEHASPGIQAVAENGGVPDLVAELEANSKVSGVTVADADGPLEPGEAITLEITSERGRRHLSIASMLICTNDGFTGLDGLKLPGRGGVPTVAYLNAYDAGTEVNTEVFGDIVPPCGPLTGFHDGSIGTGTSNPALAEGGVITAHPGVSGVADLDPAVHDWADPVAKVTITRIDNAAEYRISVSNDTNGQPFTPPVVAVHKRSADVFTVGEHASAGIQGVAENGDVPGLVAELDGADGVRRVLTGTGPVLPGDDQEFTFYAPQGTRRVSVASMLICTNDGFTGIDSERLPRWVGDSITKPINAYDAGTEVNTEAFADIVPPCGPLSGVHDGSIGTGVSNPALAEGGVITAHPGVSGGADLDPAIHDWAGSVGSITIERIG
ncbi:MAG: spondin domain-containing protein [Actinomycetota bacterium]